jgi:hypothetical protein
MARPATVITLMAVALDDELQNRGVFSIGRTECEKIITKALERSSEMARRIERGEAQQST